MNHEVGTHKPTEADTLNSHQVSWREAFLLWLRVAIYSFGGPAGQIAVMHKILVEEKRWVSENRFLHALNYTMLLPGPEAQQLATYLGWLLHLTLGGLMAGSLFILPASFPFYFSVFSMPATRSSPWSRHSFTASSRQCSPLLSKPSSGLAGKR